MPPFQYCIKVQLPCQSEAIILYLWQIINKKLLENIESLVSSPYCNEQICPQQSLFANTFFLNLVTSID